ncbi:MAG: hypothetical protein NUV97_02925 [archaeon]|nr:hypothetical protein [archaeon]MCR4343835.1 hypothetical protein [Candidatus Scalindua sp.]
MLKENKTTKKDFDLFKKECKYFIDIFELNNYKIYFNHKVFDNEDAANCVVDTTSYTAWLSLNKEQTANNEDIKGFAKHEVIHLLLGRMSNQGYARFISKAEIEEAEEELTRKLEKII